MDEIRMRGIMVYFRKQMAKQFALRLIKNPCEVNIQLLKMIAYMPDDMFYEIMIPIMENVFGKDKEKRETGIETVPHNISNL